MAIPKGKARGVQDIKTHVGMMQDDSEPYRAYMRLSNLEMERFRRGQEKESAARRIAEIDKREQEIDSEKETILQALAQREGVVFARSDPKASVSAGGGVKGFNLKY